MNVLTVARSLITARRFDVARLPAPGLTLVHGEPGCGKSACVTNAMVQAGATLLDCPGKREMDLGLELLLLRDKPAAPIVIEEPSCVRQNALPETLEATADVIKLLSQSRSVVVVSQGMDRLSDILLRSALGLLIMRSRNIRDAAIVRRDTRFFSVASSGVAQGCFAIRASTDVPFNRSRMLRLRPVTLRNRIPARSA